MDTIKSLFSLKRIISLLILLLILTGIFLFFRGPYISNTLKRLILPELSAATGRDITTAKLYINLFPLFIEARDMKVYESGDVIVSIPRVKGYVGITGLLRREINIRRLVIDSPELVSNLTVIEDVIGRVKEYLKEQRKLPFKVRIRGITLSNGRFEIASTDSVIRLKGLNSDAVLSNTTRINLSIMNAEFSAKKWPVIRGAFRTSFLAGRDSIDLRRFDLRINGSEIASSGLLPYDLKDGKLDMRLGILMESLKKVFGLKKSGEGEIRAEGVLRFLKGIKDFEKDKVPPESQGVYGIPWDKIFRSLFIDLDLKGSIYIQSLLELVNVKEKIEGPVDFSGNLRGPLDRLTGKGKAVMRDGALFGVAVKVLRCDVGYKDGMLTFNNGKASLYNGDAEAKASVQLYGGGFYSVDVRAEEIDSIPLLDLIGWRPDIPRGKVRGEFRTSGEEFRPSGWFEYRAVRPGDRDILDRIRSIRGYYTMEKDILTLYNTEARTGASVLTANGQVDIASSTISLKTELSSKNITEVSSPFLSDLGGMARFDGTVEGKFSDPFISGRVDGESISLYSYNIGHVKAVIDYRKKKLAIKEFTSRRGDALIGMKGVIEFPDALEIFVLRNPVYNLAVTVRDVDLRDLKPLYSKRYREFIESKVSGRIDADLSVRGRSPEFRGSLMLRRPRYNDIGLSSATASFLYDNGEIRLEEILIKRSTNGSEAIMRGHGVIFKDETVQFSINGRDILISDLYKNTAYPVNGRLDFRAEGRGKIDNPEINMTAGLKGLNIRAVNLGDIRVNAHLKDRDITFESFLFHEKAIIKGVLALDDLSWSARLDLGSGRYEPLMTAFLKDVPEDLLVNIKGYIDLKGKKEEFTATGVIDELNFTLYGYGFSSERDIRFSMKNWRITIPPVRMRSGASSFNIQGIVDINKEIDIAIEGSSNLSLLKGFSRKIDTIRGESEFVLSIAGRWDSPKINGGLTVSNAFLGLKGIPYRMSGVKGYLYIDEDRIVIDRLSGKIGGGDIDISGITYLKGFRIRKFYIDSVVNDITLNLSKDFPVNFNGNLLLRGTPELRTLSGEIRIKRARYKERVEWKSWLLKAKTKERPKGEIGTFEDTGLNIKIYGPENVTIDNNIARAQVRIDMLLRGTVIQPVIFGRIESISGTVYFRNNEFRIVKASADFSDPKRVNPVMEIVAETSVKGYNIRLNLEGQMEHFNLSLISDPPLPEIDILSLLTVGKFGKELKGIESGIGAGEATSFLTGKMQDVIEERVRSLTGLDRIEVDPYVSKTSGTVSPRITVSKRLLGDRLFVTYTSAVGTAENNVLKLEYILNRNVSLIGVRDEKGGIGGDVKFRFEFK